MRLALHLVAALPALSAAQQQIPLTDKLQGWLKQAQDYAGKAQDYIKTAAAVPMDAGAAKVAEGNVHLLTIDNWKSTLSPIPSTSAGGKPDEWLVFITGGNKTCNGRCEIVEKAWNISAALLSAQAKDLHLAQIDCERQELLCGAWTANVPSIWHILVPKPLPDQSSAATTVRCFDLNTTATAAPDIYEIHTKQKYLETAPYTGPLQPFNGIVAQMGLTMPLAYTLYLMSKIPSWLFMIFISFISRQYMAKRMTGRRSEAPQAAAT